MARLRASDGVELSYLDEGRGDPIVLVHGWMMSGRFWHKQVAAFRPDHRVIVPDLRGCGESNTKEGTQTVPRYAEDLHGLFEALDLERATLVGWSMGGGIAVEYLHRYGTKRVAAVGLVDFPPHLEEDPSVADKVCHNLNTRRDSFTEGFLQRMFLAPLSPEDKQWMLAESKKCEATAACEMYRAMRHTGEVPSRRPYPVPALLAFPEKGWFPKSAEPWRAQFPRVHEPRFAASKHCPFLEEPDVFNDALRQTMRLAGL